MAGDAQGPVLGVDRLSDQRLHVLASLVTEEGAARAVVVADEDQVTERRDLAVIRVIAPERPSPTTIGFCASVTLTLITFS